MVGVEGREVWATGFGFSAAGVMAIGRVLAGVDERGVVGRGAVVAGVRALLAGVVGREFTDAVLVLRTEEGVLLVLEKEARVVELLLAILGALAWLLFSD